MSTYGALGIAQLNIQTKQDFYITYSVPSAMVVGDSLAIDVNIFNNLNTAVQGEIIFDSDDEFSEGEAEEAEFNVAAG